MAVTLDGAVFDRYPRFSLYNSPYPAHDRGSAVDLYPDADGVAPSPVAGEVVDTLTVSAPSQPYAAAHDHLILLDTGEHVARILHVDPTVEVGDSVALGEPLGRLVRSGFFAPWVDNHVHLGVREADANPYRAAGSLPLALDPALDVRALRWDGTGTVVAVGETYAVLDAPAHPDPGAYFVGLAADTLDADGGPGRPTAAPVIDGGCPHYDCGGVIGGDSPPSSVAIAGTPVGRADGRTVSWADVTVRANGDPITGLSLFCAREAFGTKLVCPDRQFAVGDAVTVTVDRT